MSRTLAVLLIAGLVGLWIGQCTSQAAKAGTCFTSYACQKTISYRTCTAWWFWTRCSYRTSYYKGICKKCCAGYLPPSCVKIGIPPVIPPWIPPPRIPPRIPPSIINPVDLNLTRVNN